MTAITIMGVGIRGPAGAGVALAASDYNATGDGVTDDLVHLNAVVAACSAAGGGSVYITEHRISATLSLPSNVKLLGSPMAKLIVPNGASFPAITISNASGVQVESVTISCAGTIGGSFVTAGVYVAGTSSDTVIKNVTVTGFGSGFYVAGGSGNQCTNIILSGCISRSSTVYGFVIDECNGVELNGCSSHTSGLDAVKLRKLTDNVTLIGGYYTGATGGDGIDMYAGGRNVSVIGTVFHANGLNGMVCKNDDLNESDPSTYGIVKSVSITGVRCTDNGGSGVTVHRSSGNPDDAAEPLLSGVNINGGIFTGNTNYGIYIQAHQVTVTGAIARLNGLDGIYLEPAALDIALLGCHVAGNSVTSSGARDGMRLAGKRIQVIGGSSVGAAPAGAESDAVIAAGSQTQRYGINIESAATEVDIHAINLVHNGTAPMNDASHLARFSGPPAGQYLRSGRYITTGWGSRTTLAMVATTEYAHPILISSYGLIVRIGLEVTVAGTAGTVIRLGIRADEGGLPGTLLLDAGTVAGDGIASVEATVSYNVVKPGVYWLTATAQSTGGTLPTVRAVTGQLPMISLGTLATALSATPMAGYISANTVTGALPTPYGTPVNRSAAPPLIAIRI